MGDDRLALHRAHYRTLARVCMDLSLGGFTVHEPRRRELADEVDRECARLKRAIRAATPIDLFGKGKRKGEEGKGLSSPKVTAYFYDTLKCKPYVSRTTGSRTCDEEAIRRLMRAYVKARPVGALVLEFRQWQKRGDFLAAKRVDDDGRFRALYVPTAVSGRLQSSENPLGSGSNGQNIPRPPSPVRSIFVPDRGHVLVEWDLSRVEDRLLGGKSGDKRMMREAIAGPEVDTYSDVAESLGIASHFLEKFGPVKDDGSKVRTLFNDTDIRKFLIRYTGKQGKLAAGYGMQGDTMSRQLILNTEGALVLDPRQCDQWLEHLYKIRPGIPKYQEWIRSRILRDGFLENSWGRRYYFRVLRLTDGHYRDGYAWACQSEAGVLTNQWGFKVAAQAIKRHALPARIVQQGHDALVVSVEPTVSWDLLCLVGDSMGQPRTYHGAAGLWTLACPIGYKVGANWGAMREWKTRPSREAWEAAVDEAKRATWWTRASRRRANL